MFKQFFLFIRYITLYIRFQSDLSNQVSFGIRVGNRRGNVLKINKKVVNNLKYEKSLV